jgi:hypothetical protein
MPGRRGPIDRSGDEQNVVRRKRADCRMSGDDGVTSAVNR